MASKEERPDPAELAAITAPQQRRSDPLNDADVRQKVYANDELSRPEKFLRRVAAQKKPIGTFLAGVGTWLVVAAMLFPESKWLVTAAFLTGSAGTLLLGAGSNFKSDEYDKVKNELLKQRGLM